MFPSRIQVVKVISRFKKFTFSTNNKNNILYQMSSKPPTVPQKKKKNLPFLSNQVVKQKVETAQ